MIVLGIGDGHESHACIVRDGVITAVMAEERLSRLKADSGYPRQAIDKVIEIAEIEPSEIDIVAFAGNRGNPILSLLKEAATLSVRQWIDIQHQVWKPQLIDGEKVSIWKRFDLNRHVVESTIDEDPYFPFIERARGAPEHQFSEIFDQLRREVVKNHLGISSDQVVAFRHEDCHKTYGYYSMPKPRQRALVFTCEGGGDDSSATVSTVDETGIIEHWRSNEVHLGRLYAYVTLVLGMKPIQHEYKVMGLAPYGSNYHGQDSLEFFRQINQVEGNEIVNPKVVRDLYFSVQDALEGERFDGMAWGLQTYLEEMLCQWVANNCESYEIDNVSMSGGVAQNIKASKSLSELKTVKNIWSGPVAGDGSVGIGAAWMATREHAPMNEIDGLPTVYLGTSFDRAQIDAAIESHSLDDSFSLLENPSDQQIASWLTNNAIIGRFSGRMEFGQRALGNRSIMADPRNYKNVDRINQKVKLRDFWMPFTPSMMFEEAERLLQNPKGLYSPFMTMAFDLKPEFSDAIPAAAHPADGTVRPQMLKREDNPGYYDILRAMKEATGLGVVLNTSFNLHGEAIVESPDDAISTFLRSDLDILLFDHLAIARPGQARLS
jgi:carbamoyltransferase